MSLRCVTANRESDSNIGASPSPHQSGTQGHSGKDQYRRLVEIKKGHISKRKETTGVSGGWHRWRRGRATETGGV